MALSLFSRTILWARTIKILRRHTRSRRPGYRFSQAIYAELKKTEANETKTEEG